MRWTDALTVYCCVVSPYQVSNLWCDNEKIVTCTAQILFYHHCVDVHNTSHNPLLSILAALRDPTYWVCSAATALQKGTEPTLCTHVTERRATMHNMHTIFSADMAAACMVRLPMQCC